MGLRWRLGHLCVAHKCACRLQREWLCLVCGCCLCIRRHIVQLSQQSALPTAHGTHGHSAVQQNAMHCSCLARTDLIFVCKIAWRCAVDTSLHKSYSSQASLWPGLPQNHVGTWQLKIMFARVCRVSLSTAFLHHSETRPSCPRAEPTQHEDGAAAAPPGAQGAPRPTSGACQAMRTCARSTAAKQGRGHIRQAARSILLGRSGQALRPG